jgi:hypothetical protein
LCNTLLIYGRLLSEHPGQYTRAAVKDFVSDYWDVGAMVLAGFAVNDYGNKVFGDARFPVFVVSGAAGLLRSFNDTSRAYRNFSAGLASTAGFWPRGLDVSVGAEVANYATAAAFAASSLIFDKRRKSMQARVENTQPAPSESLDTLVE